MTALSDKEAVRLALEIAIESELQLADANRGCDSEQVAICLRRVDDFRRVLRRRYGYDRTVHERVFDENPRSVSIFNVGKK